MKGSTPVNSINHNDDDELLWGGAAIGSAINLSPQAARRKLEAGQIKSAIKRDGRWIAWRRRLRAEFGLRNGHDHHDEDGGA
jgi:hypothetical protein